MPNRSRTPKDVNRLASAIVRQAVGSDLPPKNPAAVILGRLGGLKGGAARAKSLSKKRRAEIAQKAATTRWKGHKAGTRKPA
jgi:hypothetical protein